MPLEAVIIDRVATTQTAHASTKRHLVTAHKADADGFLVQYLTVDDSLAAKCIAAQATKETVEARWRPSAWGNKLIGLTFPAGGADAELARIKAQERAELDITIDGAVAAYDAAEARVCQGCFRRWALTEVAETSPRPPIWIAEARAYWHLRCWDAKREAERPRETVEEL